MKTRRRHGVTLATLLVVWTTACTTWQPSVARPADVIPAERPSAVRLTLADGTVTTVLSPVLRNDSIVSGELGRAGVAAVDVGVLEVRRFSPARTIGLVAAGVVAAATWAAVATGSSGSAGDPLPLPKGFAPSVLHGIAWLGSLFH